MHTARSPFLFGAQYYRAPTPGPECWEADHARMQRLGFNSVKYWVQWRWSHRRNDRFVFDHELRLMDLAQRHGLAVTINTVFDVSPVWLFERYPDAKQVMQSGRVVEPEAVSHRSGGGSPGPCYNHPGAREERAKFLQAAVEAFRGHPALDLWDLWNEPEQCYNARHPDRDTMVCYCPHCAAGFREWLRAKYGTLDALNAVWGRPYESWDDVEAARNPHTITDFIDWREFHLDTLTSEARWRFDLVRRLDPAHAAFLHVVPNNLQPFNSVTCADDFALAALCDVWAASLNGGGAGVPYVTSPARGRIVYNTETHVNFGITGMHQGRLHLADLLREFVPQIGMGVRGFQFWQFRAEILGFESPAWGVVRPDGSDRPVTRAVEEFWAGLAPDADALATAPAPRAEVGIWKSRKNDVFQFAIHGNLASLATSIAPYAEALYWRNVPHVMVDDAALAAGRLDGLRLLILPSPYYLTRPEADALDAWVRAGGTVWSEAHLGGYDGTRGRHSTAVPGCGLAESWGLREEESTSSYRLDLAAAEAFHGPMVDDVRKALAAAGTTGGREFPVGLADGGVVWGAERCAWLAGHGLEPVGAFDTGGPLLGWQAVGAGQVFYAGTHLGQGSVRDPAAFAALLRRGWERAGVRPTLGAEGGGQVHADLLLAAGGRRFLVIVNRADAPGTLALEGEGRFTGVWTGLSVTLGAGPQAIPGRAVDLLVEG